LRVSTSRPTRSLAWETLDWVANWYGAVAVSALAEADVTYVMLAAAMTAISTVMAD